MHLKDFFLERTYQAVHRQPALQDVARVRERAHIERQRNPVVLDHAEELLRTRTSERRGYRRQDSRVPQVSLERRQVLGAVAGEGMKAAQTRAWLVVEDQDATRLEHAKHLTQNDFRVPSVMHRRGDEHGIEAVARHRKIVEVRGDERSLCGNAVALGLPAAVA